MGALLRVQEIKRSNEMTKKIDNRILVHIVLIIGAIATVFPFVWMILTAFKDVSETMQIPPTLLPTEWKFQNFVDAFNVLPYAELYKNTIAFTVVTVVGQVLFCSMAGYAFARIKFKGSNILFLAVLSVLMVPSQIFIIPQFEIIRSLNLVNTITALFLPNLFSAFGTFMMRQYFMGLSLELEEAAMLDGATHFDIFFKIMLPLVKPGMVALAISSALYAWNTMLWPLIVNTSVNKMTLSAGLASLQDQHATNYPVLMAGALLAIWPMILVFILFQRQFMEGIASTGSKE